MELIFIIHCGFYVVINPKIEEIVDVFNDYIEMRNDERYINIKERELVIL